MYEKASEVYEKKIQTTGIIEKLYFKCLLKSEMQY